MPTPYFFSRFLNKKISNLSELSDAILGMRKRFYLPYIRSIVKSRTGMDIWETGILFLPFVSLILKYNYYKRLKKINSGKLSLFLGKSPDLVIFASVVYILGSISEKGIDEELLGKGKNMLGRVYKIKGRDWESISLDYANAYISFFLQKI
mgnify:CR=1 FL=1